jgi:hypothetical protein
MHNEIRVASQEATLISVWYKEASLNFVPSGF